MISLIFSVLAFLTAVASLALTVEERKRSVERGAAALQYADAAINDAVSKLEPRIAASIDAAKSACEQRLDKLEQGAVPNYEQAKEAAGAVNNFNQGITNILNYDPMESLRRQRSQEGE